MKRKNYFAGVLTLGFFLILPAGVFAGGSKQTAPEPAPVLQETPVPEENKEKIKMYFFYEELCGNCHTDVDRFISILQENLPLAERDQYPNTISMLNIHETMGRSVYMDVTDEMGLDRGMLETPFMILGGRVFQGYDSIASNIKEAYLTAAEDLYVGGLPYNPRTRKTGAALFDDYSVNPDHVTMVYFYRIVCPYCAQVTPFIDALPKTVVVNGKERPLDIIRINTRSGNNGERVAAFFDAWNVPDEDRMVPIVFFSNSYLADVEPITSELNTRLAEPPVPWKLISEKK
jgi:thiol-disulfide isomerase/thioredoxin